MDLHVQFQGTVDPHRDILLPLTLQAEFLHLSLDDYLGYVLRGIATSDLDISLPAPYSLAHEPYGVVKRRDLENTLHYEFMVTVPSLESQSERSEEVDNQFIPWSPVDLKETLARWEEEETVGDNLSITDDIFIRELEHEGESF